MRILVTGAAGFIGSHLCERLLQTGVEVIGIDGFINPALTAVKQRNLRELLPNPHFQFHQLDIQKADLVKLLADVQVVYHLAGLPGVRTCWGEDFKTYVEHNILATQVLLEAVRECPLHKFIYISTSSIYGERAGKIPENSLPVPLSPYGVSKLTGEYLCKVYHEAYGLPIIILRYFTVYGPRQRADMAFYRFINGIIRHEPLEIYGDGTQTRDFTYISDCVEATAAVWPTDGIVGETINIGGKERASILEVISLMEELLQQKAALRFRGGLKGEPKDTWADITKAQVLLNYNPAYSLKVGLKQQIDYQLVNH